MKKLINIFSRLFTVTNTEKIFLIFIIIIFSFGAIAKYCKLSINSYTNTHYNYDYYDSLFNAVAKNTNKEANHSKKDEKRVDSELELLDFSNQKLYQKKIRKKNLKTSSININTADINELTNLPGIGTKTAEKIILYRKNNSGFKSLDELLKVKGIGIKKLAKIKNYLINIEK